MSANKTKKTKNKSPTRKEVYPKVTIGNYSKHTLYEDGTVEFEIDYDAAKLYVEEILREYRLNKE